MISVVNLPPLKEILVPDVKAEWFAEAYVVGNPHEHRIDANLCMSVRTTLLRVARSYAHPYARQVRRLARLGCGTSR